MRVIGKAADLLYCHLSLSKGEDGWTRNGISYSGHSRAISSRPMQFTRADVEAAYPVLTHVNVWGRARLQVDLQPNRTQAPDRDPA